jgi:hypothetical protein
MMRISAEFDTMQIIAEHNTDRTDIDMYSIYTNKRAKSNNSDPASSEQVKFADRRSNHCSLKDLIPSGG